VLINLAVPEERLQRVLPLMLPLMLPLPEVMALRLTIRLQMPTHQLLGGPNAVQQLVPKAKQAVELKLPRLRSLPVNVPRIYTSGPRGLNFPAMPTLVLT
jgi:hypothetical protein